MEEVGSAPKDSFSRCVPTKVIQSFSANAVPSATVTPIFDLVPGAAAILDNVAEGGCSATRSVWGKTIEAGLVLKEYLLRQMVQRVLILTPSGLVEQWNEKLASKFKSTEFVTYNDERFRQQRPKAWLHFPYVIALTAKRRYASCARWLSPPPGMTRCGCWRRPGGLPDSERILFLRPSRCQRWATTNKLRLPSLPSARKVVERCSWQAAKSRSTSARSR